MNRTSRTTQRINNDHCKCNKENHPYGCVLGRITDFEVALIIEAWKKEKERDIFTPPEVNKWTDETAS